MPDEIVPSVSIDALLVRRDAAVDCLRRIRATVVEYLAIAEAVKLGEGYEANGYARAPGKWTDAFETRGYKTALLAEDWLQLAIANVDAGLWEHLMALSGVRTFMHAEAKAQWDEQIDKNKTPPLTRDNIERTFRALLERRQEFFEDGVVKLFRSLSWDYKSNRPHKFGTRLIVERFCDWRFDIFSAGHESCNVVDDLIRACCILDKKPEPDHRNGCWNGIVDANRAGAREWSNDYVRLKTFKNGNAHLYPLRADLVDQLNLIIHKRYPDALPPRTE